MKCAGCGLEFLAGDVKAWLNEPKPGHPIYYVPYHPICKLAQKVEAERAKQVVPLHLVKES